MLSLKAGWRCRVNDYRIICQMEDNALLVLVLVLVLVLKTRHRKEVYDYEATE